MQKLKRFKQADRPEDVFRQVLFDMSIDYDSLSKAGSIMGSGGMIVMDENTCMVDVAKYFMAFLRDESCGKCYTCRKGTQRMHEILDDISKGQATFG